MEVDAFTKGIKYPKYPKGFRVQGTIITSQTLTMLQVRMVSFTGSTLVGQRIAQLTAASMKKVSLELGGKNAAVVFSDADMEAAPMEGDQAPANPETTLPGYYQRINKSTRKYTFIVIQWSPEGQDEGACDPRDHLPPQD